MLKKKFPELPDLETKQGPYRGRWTLALGTISNAREFFRKIAEDYEMKFHEDMWRGEEVIESPISNLVDINPSPGQGPDKEIPYESPNTEDDTLAMVSLN